jgi:hypothetical protein
LFHLSYCNMNDFLFGCNFLRIRFIISSSHEKNSCYANISCYPCSMVLSTNLLLDPNHLLLFLIQLLLDTSSGKMLSLMIRYVSNTYCVNVCKWIWWTSDTVEKFRP